jgi:solute carrier family 35 protein C2
LLDHPVVFVYLVYPLMWAVVFVFSCLKEQWWYTIPHSKWLSNPIDVFVDMVIFAVGALMAFCLTLAEFELLNETSALTMMMFGVVKDIAAILLSMVVFGDKFGITNVGGLMLCLAGVIGYNKYKWDGMKNRALASGKLDADAENDDNVPLVDFVATTSPDLRRRSNDGFSIA